MEGPETGTWKNLVDIERFVLRAARERLARNGMELDPRWDQEAVAMVAAGPVYRFGASLLITHEAARAMVDLLLIEAVAGTTGSGRKSAGYCENRV